MEAAPAGTSDWAAETTVGGAGVSGAPIVAGGGVPPPTGGFDQDWNVTASTHTKDWADDDWGGAEPQPVVRRQSTCTHMYRAINIPPLVLKARHLMILFAQVLI